MTRSNRSATGNRGAHLRVALVWLLAGIGALTCVWHVGRYGLREPSLGFTSYYTAAWLVVHDDAPPRLYDNQWFLAQVPRAGIHSSLDIFNINPPTAALLLAPLSTLDPYDAKTAWLVLNVAFLVATLLVLRTTLASAFPTATRNRYWFPALCGLSLAARPVQENLRLGQAYILMLLLAVCALRGFVRGDDRQAGLSLGTMLALKTSGALLWVAPLMERRARAFIWGAAAVVCWVVVSLPFLGPAVWWEYPQWLPSLHDQRWTGVVAYQTLPSFAHHLTSRDEGFNPHPPIDAPWLAEPLSTALVVVPLLGTLFALWPFARELPEEMLRAVRFGALLALSVPLQPLGEDHHYTLLVPSIAIALLASATIPAGTRRALTLAATGVGTFLIVAPLPYESSALVNGWRSLLAYPRVYGALLVASALIAYSVRRPADWRIAMQERSAGDPVDHFTGVPVAGAGEIAA